MVFSTSATMDTRARTNLMMSSLFLFGCFRDSLSISEVKLIFSKYARKEKQILKKVRLPYDNGSSFGANFVHILLVSLGTSIFF